MISAVSADNVEVVLPEERADRGQLQRTVHLGMPLQIRRKIETEFFATAACIVVIMDEIVSSVRRQKSQSETTIRDILHSERKTEGRWDQQLKNDRNGNAAGILCRKAGSVPAQGI